MVRTFLLMALLFAGCEGVGRQEYETNSMQQASVIVAISDYIHDLQDKGVLPKPTSNAFSEKTPKPEFTRSK